MHQSGHSREHSMQTVQFSSMSAMTPRVRAGSLGLTCGYCWVAARRVMVLKVTPMPFSRPVPLSADMSRDRLDEAGDEDDQQGDRHEPGPCERLQLVLPQPGERGPEPDHQEREREHLERQPPRPVQER